MNEYRMTRPDAYVGTGGEYLLSDRQGYYIIAESVMEAHREMRIRFPRDSHFDCQLWKTEAQMFSTTRIEQVKR